MKLYTRTGDEGKTSVIGGRVGKDDARVEAYGTIDELNAFVGQAIGSLTGLIYEDLRSDLTRIQHELFDCGGDLAYLDPSGGAGWKVAEDLSNQLETLIDKYDAEAPPIRRFILPGGSEAAASLHVCRTVCRRAERRVVTLAAEHEVNPAVMRYVNRLSDFFFAAARAANAREGRDDVEYVRGANVFGNGGESKG
ncbi:cob(I)yrinic acid a,c-diamide adenosyltransferase [Gorillibacterium timonense]|uniref:cob(I)yrinic acid a,c-diamide adenosyltransferase n=1 Tax=Gorillibacterium timonense TaxID=1689269 RepID=UPI00071C50AF|nr:cob(I)yrinic acid a,c-diamide adenosyltransferase [Gorillibacterium timonense]